MSFVTNDIIKLMFTNWTSLLQIVDSKSNYYNWPLRKLLKEKKILTFPTNQKYRNLVFKKNTEFKYILL